MITQHPYYTTADLLGLMDQYDQLDDVPRVPYELAETDVEEFRPLVEHHDLMFPIIYSRIDEQIARLELLKEEVKKRGVMAAVFIR